MSITQLLGKKAIYGWTLLNESIEQERGHPLKGKSREKTPLHEKNTLFLLGSNLRPSTALFDPPIRACYFLLFGSRTGLLSVSS